MKYIMDDIGYLNLSKAASRLEASVSDLINLASKGKITLSVNIPTDSSLWLMSVKKNLSSIKYKQDLYIGGIHLYPKKVAGAVLINLSKEDCLKFNFSNLRQGTFESVYVVDNMAHCLDSSFNYLELMSTDKMLFSDYPSKDGIAYVYNEVFLNACKNGFIALNGPGQQYIRQFVLFKNTFSVPTMGTSLSEIEILDITEQDLVINSNDFNKLHKECSGNSIINFDQNLKINKIIEKNNARLKGELGDWCSNVLHYLIYFSYKVNEAYSNQKENLNFLDKNSSKITYKQNVVDEVTEFLKLLSHDNKPVGTRFVEYFLKLAAPTNLLFNKEKAENIKALLIKKDIDCEIDLPLQILVMIFVAKEFQLNQKEKKKTTEGRLQKLGFTQSLGEHASTVIRRF